MWCINVKTAAKLSIKPPSSTDLMKIINKIKIFINFFAAFEAFYFLFVSTQEFVIPRKFREIRMKKRVIFYGSILDSGNSEN